VLALATSACAPSLATLRPASVPPRGTLAVTAGVELGVPTGTIVSTIDAGRSLANAASNGGLTADQERQVFEAGVIAVASPPSASPHLAIAYTPLDRLELDLTYANGGWRVGARYQLLRHETAPCDLTVGVGVARSTYEIPLSDFVPLLEIDDLTRWTLDVPILVGTSRSWYRVWAGPKLLWSHLDTALRLTVPGADVELASFEGHATYAGAQAGIALGYRRVFVAVELTLAEAWGSADVSVTTLPELRPVSWSGFVVYPAFAVMGEI
jgi:hypothetical protein